MKRRQFVEPMDFFSRREKEEMWEATTPSDEWCGSGFGNSRIEFESTGHDNPGLYSEWIGKISSDGVGTAIFGDVGAWPPDDVYPEWMYCGGSIFAKILEEEIGQMERKDLVWVFAVDPETEKVLYRDVLIVRSKGGSALVEAARTKALMTSANDDIKAIWEDLDWFILRIGTLSELDE
jgi:hypothetical protein